MRHRGKSSKTGKASTSHGRGEEGAEQISE